MTVHDAFQFVGSLAEYCNTRYGILPTAISLANLISEYNLYRPVDPCVWLKTRLIELGFFSAGCSMPPKVRLSTCIHLGWPGGEIVPPLFALGSVSVPLCEMQPCDRHRYGTIPYSPSDDYDEESLDPI